MQNVIVEALALTNFDGFAGFARSDSNSTGALAENGELRVPCRRLDACIGEDKLPRPDLLKLDVEGAEAAVLEGAAHTLRTCRPIVLVATHGERPHAACCRLLADLDYEVRSLAGGPADGADELVAIPRSSRPA